MKEFARVLRAESAGSVLATATNWEDVEIQEESESGTSVTSKIRLPVQVRAGALTPPLCRLLLFCSLTGVVVSAAVLVPAVSAVPAVCGGQQSGGARPSAAHPAGAAAGLSGSGPGAVQRADGAPAPRGD